MAENTASLPVAQNQEQVFAALLKGGLGRTGVTVRVKAETAPIEDVVPVHPGERGAPLFATIAPPK